MTCHTIRFFHPGDKVTGFMLPGMVHQMADMMAAEMTPDVAAAIKTLENAMANMQPMRRVGSDHWAQQRLHEEHQLTDAQYKLWAVCSIDSRFRQNYLGQSSVSHP
eukprot:SAG31_NODE_95_length_25901_cov_24.763700_17_plen_106_part_00